MGSFQDKNFDDNDAQREFEKYSKKFDEDKMNDVLEKEDTAMRKAGSVSSNFLEDVSLGYHMIKDWYAGSYHAPMRLIMSLGIALTYLISPIDAIPDFIPLLGLTDDLAVWAFVLNTFRGEIEQYKQWRNS